jgi:hypothetical protein
MSNYTTHSGTLAAIFQGSRVSSCQISFFAPYIRKCNKIAAKGYEGFAPSQMKSFRAFDQESAGAPKSR